jgi:hypothetical protein
MNVVGLTFRVQVAMQIAACPYAHSTPAIRHESMFSGSRVKRGPAVRCKPGFAGFLLVVMAGHSVASRAPPRTWMRWIVTWERLGSVPK